MTDPMRGKFTERQRAAASARDRDIESDKRRRTAVRGVTVQPQPTPNGHDAIPYDPDLPELDDTNPGMTDYDNIRAGQRQTLREAASGNKRLASIDAALIEMNTNVRLIADTIKADFDRRTAIEVARIAAEAEVSAAKAKAEADTRKAQLDSGTAIALAKGSNRKGIAYKVIAPVGAVAALIGTYYAARLTAPTSPAATSPQKATP